jgi:hypothetical protein
VGLLHSLFEVGVDDLTQIVDIVEEYIVDFVDRGIDITRNRNVDENTGLFFRFLIMRSAIGRVITKCGAPVELMTISA